MGCRSFSLSSGSREAGPPVQRGGESPRSGSSGSFRAGIGLRRGRERLVRRMPRRGLWRLGVGSGYGVEQTTFAIGLLAHLRRESIHILHVQDPRVALIVQRARQLGWVSTRSILGHGTNEAPEFLQKFTYLQHLAPHHLEQVRAAGVWKPTWTAIPNFINTDMFHPGTGGAIGPSWESRKAAWSSCPSRRSSGITSGSITWWTSSLDCLDQAPACPRGSSSRAGRSQKPTK